MRISDWSSDVCSSDLVIKALSAQIDDPEGRPVRDCDIGCQCRVILERRIEQRQAAVDTQPRYGLDPGFQLQALDPGIRSEEHTSELQSLMRISSAVFCLKTHNNA